MKSIFTRLVITVAAMAGTGFVSAAPAPQYGRETPVVNDGYLKVINVSNLDEAMPPRFCPPDTHIDGSGDSCKRGDEGLFNTATVVPPVTAQEALDLRYGPKKVVVVGVAPFTWNTTVIYWRFVTPAAR